MKKRPNPNKRAVDPLILATEFQIYLFSYSQVLKWRDNYKVMAALMKLIYAVLKMSL
jgi:hypothetical protein